MPDFNPVPSSLMTIRFQDCDPFNHLNNGRYVDYFLNAREDHLLEHYGLDIYRIARETGLIWVVSTSQIAYLRPAFLMEKVVVETQLIRFSPKHVEVEMRLWDASRTTLKSFCWMGFVYFDLRQSKVAEHSAEYVDLFERVVAPVEGASFSERSRILSGKKRGIPGYRGTRSAKRPHHAVLFPIRHRECHALRTGSQQPGAGSRVS